MLIKKIILYRYKRFFLNNIEKLVYTPENQNQVILGSNGSGKSSLFRELTPLPADIKKNYHDGGYKEIYIEHLGSMYILKSGVDGITKHNFIKDGIELNTGGTKKVQLELVESHFNINSKIMNILLSVDNFTVMSLNERKEILSLCSTVDYSYALSVFLKLKSRYRDIVGGIKLTNDEIVKNEVLVKNTSAIDKLKKDRNSIVEYINYLKTSLYRDVKDIDFYLYKEKVKNSTFRLNKLLLAIGKDSSNIKELEKCITKKQTELELTLKNIDSTSKSINDLEVVGNLESKDELINKKNRLKSELDKIKPLLIIDGLDIENSLPIVKEFSNIKTDLIDLFSTIDNYNTIRFLEKNEKDAIEEKFNIVNDKLKKVEHTIIILNRDIEHIEEHMKETGKISCPKCEHSWYPNVNIDNLKKLKNDLTKYLDIQIRLKEEFYKIEKHRNMLIEYKEYIRNLKSIISYNLQLKPIWSYFFTLVDLNKSTSDFIVTTLNKINIILGNYEKYNNIDHELKLVENDLGVLEKMNNLTKDISKGRLKSLEKELENLTESKHRLEKEIEHLTIKINAYRDISVLYRELRSILESGFINNTIKSFYNESTINIIGDLEKIESEITYKISQIELSFSKLESDKIKLDNYKKKENIYKDILKALSPSEGLIAKSMNSFINKFISDMNSVINTIWSYPMELSISDIEEDILDLNYKFKVVVNNDEIIEDISKLSSSMQEIVNLAFKIILCRYLNLRDVPLYLDEFGSTFDSKHRNRAYQVVDKILSSDFKQIFMICHYESLYGSLQNTDFNVLNQDNIELNENIEKNKNFEISYG